MKRLVLITVTIGATLGGIFLLWVFGPVLGLFAGSLAVSAALRPLVRQLEERRIARGIGIVFWYVLVLVVFAALAFVFGVEIGDELASAAEALPGLYDQLIVNWQQGSPLQQAVIRGLPDVADLLLSAAPLAGLAFLGSVTGGAISFGVLMIAALSLAFYWLIEVTHFERLWLSVLPVGARVRAREAWRRAETAVGTYIRTTVRAIVMASLLLFVLYELTNLPFAATLALVGGLAHLVPRIGPALALVPVFGAALTLAPIPGIIVAAGSIGIQVLTHQTSERSMRTEGLKVNPLLQVLLLLALVEVGGLWAMIFAPPLAALIQVLYANLLAANVERPQPEREFERLEMRLARLRATADPANLELASTLRRSDDLLRQSRELLHARQVK